MVVSFFYHCKKKLMSKYFFSFILVLSLFSCNFNQQKVKTSKKVTNPSLEIFSINSSIRALKAIDKNSCWFAGASGLIGFTIDGGNTWQLDTLVFEGSKPEFRSIEVIDSSVYVLSVGSPALLFKRTLNDPAWELVYREDDPNCFYNSMKFLNPRDGYAIGDPIDDHLAVLVTRNGGQHWRKVPPTLLPETFKGEAGFAASNTNIELHGNNIWIATGGKAARVFKSKNRGQSWEVFNTPIVQGGTMTGIFSIDFYNDSLGIIWGGDWEDQSANSKNKAITKDGGETWTLLADGEFPGYCSCVQFVPNSDGNEIFAVGIPGIAYSFDQGKNWTGLSDVSFYTIRIPEKGNTAWLAGKNKIGKLSW